MRRDCVWEPITANIDWCEANCEVSNYVAEFWNTISNVAIWAPAAFGLYQCFKNRAETRFKILFSLVFIVGLGSTWFHGTLTRIGQIVDEVPMIFGGLSYSFIALDMKDGVSKWVPLWFTLYGMAGIASLLFLPHQPFFFQSSYILLVLAVTAQCIKMWWNHKSRRVREMYEYALLFTVLGAFCWLCDYHFCDFVSSIYFRTVYQLHSWWHVGAGLGCYLAAMFLYYLRCEHLKQNPRLITGSWRSLFLPYIVIPPAKFKSGGDKAAHKRADSAVSTASDATAVDSPYAAKLKSQ